MRFWNGLMPERSGTASRQRVPSPTLGNTTLRFTRP